MKSKRLLVGVFGSADPAEGDPLYELARRVGALHRAGSLGPRPVVLLGAAWRRFLHHLVLGDMIEDAQLSITRVAETAEDAVLELDRSLVVGGALGE